MLTLMLIAAVVVALGRMIYGPNTNDDEEDS